MNEPRRRFAFGWTAIAVAAAISLWGCGGSGSGGSTVASPAALASMLQRAGFGCSDFAQDDFTGPHGKSGHCQVDGEKVDLATFDSAERNSEMVRLTGSVGCSIVNSPLLPTTAPSSATLVYGSNWNIATSSEASARRIAASLKAKTKTYHC